MDVRTLLLPIIFQLLFSGCSGQWRPWEEKELVRMSPATFSQDGLSIYFSRSYHKYQERRQNYELISSLPSEYQLFYKKTSIYKMNLSTRDVREVQVISPENFGDGTINILMAGNSYEFEFPDAFPNFLGERGGNLYYMKRNTTDSKQQLYTTYLETGKEESLHTFSTDALHLNHDGTKIYFLSGDRDSNGWHPGLTVFDMANKTSTILSDASKFSPYHSGNAYFELVSITNDDKAVQISVNTYPNGLFFLSVSTETGDVSQLDKNIAKKDQLYISPDERHFVYYSKGNQYYADLQTDRSSIYTANGDGYDRAGGRLFTTWGGTNLTTDISKSAWGIRNK